MFKLKFKAYCMPYEIFTVKNIVFILLLVVVTIQLLHFIECDMMCYGALKSNIDQGRRPRSILLFSAP